MRGGGGLGDQVAAAMLIAVCIGMLVLAGVMLWQSWYYG